MSASLYETQTVTLAAGEFRKINGQAQFVSLVSATDVNGVAIRFSDGGAFFPLIYGIGIEKIDVPGFWIQNTSANPNTITVSKGNAAIRDNRQINASPAMTQDVAVQGLVKIADSNNAAIVIGRQAMAASLGITLPSESTDADGTVLVCGRDAPGAAITENPVPLGAANGGVVRRVASDANGNLVSVGPTAAGSAIGTTAPVLSGVSDGTNVQRMHADTAGNAMVVGPVAAGVAVSGNPVRVAGNDGTTTRDLKTDASGNQVVVGAVAAGSAVGTTAPVMVAGTDGTNAQRIAVVGDNIATPAAGNQTAIPGLYNSDARALTSARVAFLSIDRGGKVLTTPCGTLDPVLAGYTVTTLDVAAGTNAGSIKAAAGMVYEVSAINCAAYDVFLRIYNKASAPTVGTDVSFRTICVPAGKSVSITFPGGAYFDTGIAYATTKLVAYNDATALVAHDLQFSIQTA